MEKEKTVLEVCTDSVESAIAAKKGGADRIELCSNLIIGGTTPDTKMYRIIQNEAGIPARILIRPRFGDFCYSKYEKELILEQIILHPVQAHLSLPEVLWMLLIRQNTTACLILNL